MNQSVVRSCTLLCQIKRRTTIQQRVVCISQRKKQKGSAYKAIQVEASIIEVDVGIGSLAEPRKSATRVVDEREGVHD